MKLSLPLFFSSRCLTLIGLLLAKTAKTVVKAVLVDPAAMESHVSV